MSANEVKMLETYEKNSQKKLTATILAILVVAGSIIFADHLKAESATTARIATPNSTIATQASNASTTSSTGTTGSSSSTGVKDGTYTATSDYYVPHGDETIQVRLTINNGVIADATIQNSESDRDSARYQEDFAAEYKSYVVGKKISGLRLSNVAGASDTTDGFNDALSQIASKAQA